jgi:hypothetical protein
MTEVHNRSSPLSVRITAVSTTQNISSSPKIRRNRWTKEEQDIIASQLLSGKSVCQIKLPVRTSTVVRSKVRQIKKNLVETSPEMTDLQQRQQHSTGKNLFHLFCLEI